MALATVNGVDVLEARITMPRIGAWHADLVVNSEAALEGRCTLAIDGGLTLVGTATAGRSGVFAGTAYLRLGPGADGLGKLARAQHYRNVALSVVLRDLLAAAGETLAASADAALLRTQFVAWTQRRSTVGESITALVADRRRPAAAWRALPDGTIWVGPESWPDAGLRDPDDVQELAALPPAAVVELGVEAPRLLPGQTIGGRRVSAVEHLVRDGAVRTTAWMQA